MEGTVISRIASPNPYAILAIVETVYHPQSFSINPADPNTNVAPLRKTIDTVSARLRPNVCSLAPIIGATNISEI